MALFDVFMDVEYTDAAERTATRSYLLREQYDEADGLTMEDVFTQAANALVALNVLTMDQIANYSLRMVIPTGAAAAAINSNNQVEAFSRIQDTGGEKSAIQIPAWDDTVFDENNQNVLSDAYDTAVAALALFLRAPETGVNFALSPDYSQSRTRKSRNIIHD